MGHVVSFVMESSRTRARDVAAVAPLVVLAFGGYIKGSKYLNWVPVDITLIAAAIVAVQLVLVWLGRTHARMPRPALLALWALSLLGGLIGMNDPDNTYAHTKLLHVFALAPLCVLGGVYLLQEASRRRAWLYSVAGMGFVTLLAAYLDPQSGTSGRLAAQGGSTIGLGRAAGAALVVLGVLLLLERTRRTPHGILVAIAAAALFSAASRGPVLGAAAAIALAILIARGRGRWGRVALVTLVGMAAYEWARGGGVNSRLFLSGDTSSQIRSYLWGRAADAIREHPLGVGWGSLYDYLGVAVLDTGYTQYPHNVVLEVTSEAGWVAGLMLVIVLVVAGVSQWRAARTPVETAMLALLIFAFVNALVSGDVNGNRGLWVAIGAGLAASLLRQPEPLEDADDAVDGGLGARAVRRRRGNRGRLGDRRRTVEPGLRREAARLADGADVRGRKRRRGREVVATRVDDPVRRVGGRADATVVDLGRRSGATNDGVSRHGHRVVRRADVVADRRRRRV